MRRVLSVLILVASDLKCITVMKTILFLTHYQKKKKLSQVVEFVSLKKEFILGKGKDTPFSSKTFLESIKLYFVHD